jgi:hypothetical protein
MSDMETARKAGGERPAFLTFVILILLIIGFIAISRLFGA